MENAPQQTRDENQTRKRREKKKREKFLIEEFILMSNRISFYGRQDYTGPVQTPKNKKLKLKKVCV